LIALRYSPHIIGFGAAFGAPIGGVLLVLEEAASFWDVGLILTSFFCGMSAKFIFLLFLQGAFVDSWGAIEQKGFLFFGMSDPRARDLQATSFVFLALLGLQGNNQFSSFIINSTYLLRRPLGSNILRAGSQAQ